MLLFYYFIVVLFFFLLLTITAVLLLLFLFFSRYLVISFVVLYRLPSKNCGFNDMFYLFAFIATCCDFFSKRKPGLSNPGVRKRGLACPALFHCYLYSKYVALHIYIYPTREREPLTELLVLKLFPKQKAPTTIEV